MKRFFGGLFSPGKRWPVWLLAGAMVASLSLGEAPGAVAKELTIYHTNNVTGHLFGCPT